MDKALIIQIGNISLPQGLTIETDVVDCRCINDFCSFAGDALVGDLKDENGTPYYRLYSPIGKLLHEFKINNPESFDTLLSNWYIVLTDLLQNGINGSEEILLRLTDDFADWLLMHENDHYVAMGQELKNNGNDVLLNRKDILNCIMPSIMRLVREKISVHKSNIRAIVLSGKINVGQSYITSKLCSLGNSRNGIDRISFYNLNDWKCLLDVELRERIDCLDDRRAFKVDDFVLGNPVPINYKHIEGNLNYKGGQIKISNCVCEVITANKGTELFDNLVNCIFTKNREIKSQSFAECHHLLNPLGFKVERTKLTMNKDFKETSDNLPISALAQVGIASAMIAGSALMVIANYTGQIAYRDSLVKDTTDYTCKLMFFSDKAIPGEANNLGMRRRMPNTMDEISISIKRKV